MLAGLLVFILAFYVYMDMVTGSQIRHHNTMRMDTIRDRISREIDWLEEIGYRISRDNRLMKESESPGDIRYLVTDFKHYLNMSTWVKSMAFYQKRYGRVISTERVEPAGRLLRLDGGNLSSDILFGS